MPASAAIPLPASRVGDEPEEDLSVYPTSDGEPVGETDRHIDAIFYCKGALLLHFQEQKNRVYVAADNFFYYEKGNPRRCISPDVYVVFGVPQQQRDSYFVWREGNHTPAVVIEVTSKGTMREDTEKKFLLYERKLNVEEYFLYDPTSDYLTPNLQGYRRVGRNLTPITPDEQGRLYSEQLRLMLVQENDRLRLYDPLTDRYLPTVQEAEARAEAERQRAEFAVQLVRREQKRADTEAQRANAEAQARQAAEQELEALRAELERLKQGQSG